MTDASDVQTAPVRDLTGVQAYRGTGTHLGGAFYRIAGDHAVVSTGLPVRIGPGRTSAAYAKRPGQ